MSQYLAIWWDSPPIPRFSHKVWGKWGQSTSGGGNKATSKEGVFLVRRKYRVYNSER